ncbi:hybrid sensor histidine kinase/response regulator [Isosphaeraceae bacterium EP7]
MEEPRPTLLVVDDEKDVLESVRHFFRRSYRVVTAEGGASALEILRREPVHVILSDQRMPGISGDELLRQARDIQPDAVRLLFTGYADLPAVIRAVNEGQIFRYISKPWDAAELESIVRQAAAQATLLAERKALMAELTRTNADLSRANRDLAEADQLKTAFLEVASHEFNTPITLILGLSELLLLSGAEREPMMVEMLEALSAGAQQLARMVANTLTLLHGNDFRQTMRTSPVDLTALLRSDAEKLAPFLGARGQTLTLDLADNLGTFEVDADKVSGAVVNLLTNAIKFTPDGGTIRLEAAADDEGATIRVVDTGIGIDPAALRRLFTPFFTELDASRHSSGDFGFNKRGLGLGLSLVRLFAEMHGGRVHAESDPGSGSTVTIWVPRRPIQDRPPVSEAGRAPSTGSVATP